MITFYLLGYILALGLILYGIFKTEKRITLKDLGLSLFMSLFSWICVMSFIYSIWNEIDFKKESC